MKRNFFAEILWFLLCFLVVAVLVTWGMGCDSSVIQKINPCETIFVHNSPDADDDTSQPMWFCDPLGWDLLFLKIPDFGADPTCVIPGFCGDGFLPQGSDGN